MSSWTDELALVLTSPRTAADAADLARFEGDFRYSLELVFATVPPAGPAAGEILWIDRCFRYATRAVQNGETVEALLRRGGRPVGLLDGLAFKALEPGSVRTALAPSGRMLAQGLIVLGAAMQIATGVVFLDQAGDEQPLHPGYEPYLKEPPPTGVELKVVVEHGGQQMTVTFRREEGYYAPLLPPDQLP